MARKRAMRITVNGVAEIKRKLDFFQGAQFGADVMKELAPVAEDLAEEIRKASKAVGAPKDVQDSIFSYAKIPSAFKGKQRRYRITGLVGVNRGYKSGGRTGPSYFEWVTTTGPGKVSRKGGGWTIIRKREKGTTLGMSLASVYEFGTSNRYPRPYFRPTVKARVAMIRAKSTQAMLNAIEKHSVKSRKVA